jgi:hypothetical protein
MGPSVSISSSRRRARVGLAGLVCGVLGAGNAACTPDACVRESDCAAGFTCTAAACVPDPVDAGPADAGPRDAATTDAGRDAGADAASSADAASGTDAGG